MGLSGISPIDRIRSTWLCGRTGRMIDADAVARKWYNLHVKHGNLSRRFFDDPLLENRIGAIGEIAFGTKYDVMKYWLGLEERPYGDDKDFDIPGLGTFDVKTAQKNPIWLLAKAGKAKCDFYVLVRYFSDQDVRILGWEYGANLAKVKPEDKGGKGIMSHFIKTSELLPMSILADMIEAALRKPELKVQLSLPFLSKKGGDP